MADRHLLSSRPSDAWRVFDEAFTRKLQSERHHADPLAPEKDGAVALCRAAEGVLRARLVNGARVPCSWAPGAFMCGVCKAEWPGHAPLCWVGALLSSALDATGRPSDDRRTLPAWYKPERPEFRDSPLLSCCASAGMTAEQAMGEAAMESWELRRLLHDAVSRCATPIVVEVVATGRGEAGKETSG